MYEGRTWAIRIVIIIIGLVFLIRLFYVQVLDDEYRVGSAVRKDLVYPPRGLIYDRNGKLLVNNDIIYDVMVIPSKMKPFDTVAFCKLLDVNKDDFTDELAKAKAYSRYKPSAVVKEISAMQFGMLEERMYAFRGFFVQARTTRNYPKPIAAALLGYLAEVDTTDIKNSNGYYVQGDYIGKSGLEKSYEQYLRGSKGTKYVLVDALNREQGSYQNGKYDVEPTMGDDLLTGVDERIQEYGEKLLKGKIGSVVAIDPSTGEVICMVTSPSYDPNKMLGRERTANMRAMLMDESKPMFNRALTAKYPPGSTFKPEMALLGLDEGVIRESTTFTCNGGYRLSPTQMIHCHAKGTFDLHQGIQMSCNGYFCNVFRLVIDQDKFGDVDSSLANWASRLAGFGIGIKTGIDIPNESRGIVPTPHYYDKFYGIHRWKSSNIISLAIGQAEISLTPLQLANVAATIANRGYYITPHFVKKLQNKKGEKVLSYQRHNTGISEAYFDFVADAMQAVVEHGTAMQAIIPGITVCGKTGTAQNPHGKDHSLFIAFAPMDHPKIAIAVIVENAGHGGTWAAPIASLLIEKYITDTIKRPEVEQRILDLDLTKEKDTEPALEN